jgi:hypothetical protein
LERSKESHRPEPKFSLSRIKPGKVLDPHPSEQRSMSISKVTDPPPDIPSRTSVPKITLKNILIRDKKRLSYVQDSGVEKRELATIGVTQEDSVRSKEFR